MPFDTKTLWIALSISNLLFGLMMMAYVSASPERSIVRTWSIGQILKGIGIAGIVLKAQIPFPFGYGANSIVLIGCFFELTAFLGYAGLRDKRRAAFGILVGLLALYNLAVALLAHGLEAKHMATVFSAAIAVLTGLNALAMAKARRSRSMVQLVLVLSNALISGTSATRAIVALTSTDWSPASTSVLNQALFIVAYVFSISDGFGFLLLVKEDSDRTMLRLATEDELTGLASRAAFLKHAEKCRRLCLRAGQPMAMMMMDVDFFKRVNDTHGHAAGDAVLKAISGILRSHLRDVDICGRMGGEEFAMALPGSTPENTTSVAERIRHAISAQIIHHKDVGISITASFGIATLGGDVSLEQALSLADENLYAAKSMGRNRVVADGAPGITVAPHA